MNKSSQVKWMIIAVLGILVFFLIKKKTSMPASDAKVAVTERVAPAPPAPKALVFRDSEQLVTLRRLTAMEENLKIKNVFLDRNQEGVNLKIKFLPQKLWCQVGDLDIMKIDQRNDNNPPLIMTIEPLSGPRKKIYSKTVSLNQLQAPTEFNFNVQEDDSTAYFGFFICQDARKDGSCQKKKGSSFSQIYENYQKKLQWGSTEIGRYQAQDDVYYFQFLSIKDARLSIGDPSLFEQKQYSKAFSKYLAVANPSIDSDRMTETVSDLSRNTGSMAAIKTEKGLNFKLPYNDPRCTVIQTR